MKHNGTKYQAFPVINMTNRQWPNNTITSAPIWCSVDLRDGNQALINPMTLDEKLKLFSLLVKIGFKQIEVGFPSAAKVEYDFLRKIIDDGLIPDDVTIQVLCQARSELIKKTFESLDGAKNVIFHIYNSTSVAQRKIVFKKEKKEIIELILNALDDVLKYQKSFKGNLTLQYSPESFTNTELDFAKQICDSVVSKYMPFTKNKIIINLPATVEVSTPNIYADMMEWMSANLNNRENIILSSHAHNDRGTAVGATELSLLAGSQRVEGTLLGNGERTGNVDIVTLALNMYTQGVESNLNLFNIDDIVETLESITKIDTHIRHPYVGKLVYTAFSGSHQDAIKKGMSYRKINKSTLWEVPYLPIDPNDLDRTYQDIIRINAQSGKGGIAYVLENQYGFSLPKKMQTEFSSIVQKYSDKRGKEIKKEDILGLFEKTYFNTEEHISLNYVKILKSDKNSTTSEVSFKLNGEELISTSSGNGPIDSAKKAIEAKYPHEFYIMTYSEHSLEPKSHAKAVAYVQVENTQLESIYGVGKDTNTTTAAIKALICGLNLLFRAKTNG